MPNVAATIASLLTAIDNCERSGNLEWHARHAARLAYVCAEYLPSGSGIDQGTHIDRSKTTATKLVLSCSFHHMDEHGSYDGWTDHTITVRPTFDGLDVTVGGRDRNDIKNYLGDVFQSALETEVDSARIDACFDRSK